ncbi:hypothetical protein C0Q70_18565 [Pomacea canaliculata]|uniref:FIT family protein n=1 Tax=Pomacea canaliculata TaxID=400727 RepID=A0A2T7NGW3_POMCA|nr:FIT family protein CG10671-like [Pomacea canaliculata]XP_025115978.1 FIT family protein CG10671-like [Pomacea canaliculata]PVD20411.1 hypothetical protein C0Q70_18565 [Pomacea canaliculata]
MASKSGSSRRKSFTKGSHKDYEDRNVSRAGKKPLPEPTHLGHFVLMVVLKVCRSVLFVDTSVKIGIYLIGVMAGSVICDLFVVPKSYLSDKQNFLNQYFVKLGWGWTLTLLVSYVCLSSLVYCSGNWAAVRRHIMRMAIASVEWYVCVTAFRHIETTVGMCTSSQHLDRNTCIDSGSGWLGFDISGHVFLLIHNLLTISEEVKTFKEWRKLGELLEDEDLPNKRKVTNDDIKQAQSLYKGLTPYIKATFIVLALLTVLWEFMLLVSVVYRFHTLTQKVTAAFVAVFCWFLNYRVLYRLNSEWFPAYPGESSFNFLKSS